MNLYEDIQASAAYVRDKIGARKPKVGLILGSGLNALADSIENAVTIVYSDIPHFPSPGVHGHSGKLIVGEISGVTVACLQGRVHAYEGHPGWRLGYGVRTLGAIGCETIIATNAAGSFREQVPPGHLMIIDDHINLSGVNPLVGPNDDRLGTRFPSMTEAWDKGLRDLAHQAAKDAGLENVTSGVYLMVMGPSFETPAEIRAFRTLGADAVGMSTVPECIVAQHAGLKILGISSIVNLASGMSGEAITHEETMHYGAIAAVSLEKLLRALMPKLG